MGNTIWVTFQTDGEPESIAYDHLLMYALEEELDRLARKLRVTEPTTFYDYSAMAEEYAAEFGVPSKEKTFWHDAAEGLKTVEALLDHISKNSDLFLFANDAARSHWRSDLIEELKNCQSLLTKAAAENRRFHFAIID